MKDILRRLAEGRSAMIRDAVRRRQGRRKPPGSAPALVEPPRGPLPLQGGAEAPLAFDF